MILNELRRVNRWYQFTYCVVLAIIGLAFVVAGVEAFIVVARNKLTRSWLDHAITSPDQGAALDLLQITFPLVFIVVGGLMLVFSWGRGKKLWGTLSG